MNGLDIFRQKTIKNTDLELGSRYALEGEEDLIWYPSEVDALVDGQYTTLYQGTVADYFTETSYDTGYVFDENINKCEFTGYRVDCITDYALEYIDKQSEEKPFFLTISHIEPHHQNDRKHYEGPNGSKERLKDFEVPGDLKGMEGDYLDEYPDYLGCCESLDINLGRLIDKLKDKGLYDNTIIVYSSDHGSHFKTRNKEVDEEGFDDYKRSCHDGCLHVPLAIAGPGYRGGKRVSELVSTISLADRGYVIETGHINIQGSSKDLLHNEDVKKAYLGI